jgi:hypothetical protein
MSLPYTVRTSKSPLPIVRIPKQNNPLCCFEALSCLFVINGNQQRPVPRDGTDDEEMWGTPTSLHTSHATPPKTQHLLSFSFRL